MTLRSLLALTIAAATCALGVALPSPADACGGFFCNNTDLIAVDQTKERILFEIGDDGTITAHVEISYEGSPSDFSWVVPVPNTPALGVVPASTLMLLDAATSPRIIPPDQYWEDFSDPDPGGAGDDDDDDNASDDDGDGQVDVEDLPQVGPFDPEVISSDDADALADWLVANGYLITDEMRPLIAGYVAGGMKFLGMKLAPDAGVQDISPIKMTFDSTTPMIPLVLTAVAAEPEMGVLVFIAGSQRYEPTNYASLFIDEELLRADPRNGQTNYYPLISYLSEQEERKAFFTEWSNSSTELVNLTNNTWLGTDDAEEAWEYIDGVAERNAWVSRLYTRLNAVDMTVDPMFAAAGTAEISNVHDLRFQPDVHVDYAIDPQVPCAQTYCGIAGQCATTELGDGCVCEPGYTGRRIEGPNVSSLGTATTVTCQDASFDMMASLSGAPDMDMDPCEGVTCGTNGSCLPIGGVPTCQCDDGYAAAAATNDPSGLRCTEAIEIFEAEQILWPDWPTDPESHRADDDETGFARNPDAEALAECACSSVSAEGAAGGLLLLLPLIGVLRRRI
ncbi:MAG: DUF2330 domain-containing protein [Proteobacteria bacterium]|nr:DUF2330 domain-containing protein [Pseudomonadota bacterium]